MTLEEFNGWVSFHNSCYDGFEAWMLSDPSDGERNRRDVWFESLGRYPRATADWSSLQVVNLPAEYQPQGFSKHLGSLGMYCRSKQGTEQFTAAATRYAHVCGLCSNTGMVEVQMKPGCGQFKTPHQKVVVPLGWAACKCESGDKLTNFARLDRTRMLIRHEYDPVPDRTAIIEEQRAMGNHAWVAKAERFVKTGKVSELTGSVGAFEEH